MAKHIRHVTEIALNVQHTGAVAYLSMTQMCFLTKRNLCYSNIRVAFKYKKMDMYHSNVSVLYCF